MSYIECKSFITGKENVQYGLIDVELTHNVHNTSISFNNTSSTTYYNTAPDSFKTNTVKENEGTSTGWGHKEVSTKGITGRMTQGYSASGVLNSNYVNVYNGKFPIISQKIINEKNLNAGINTFDLFETTNNKVILEVTKLRNSYFSNYADKFVDLDGSEVEDPYVIASVRIVQILKSNNKVISELEMLGLYYGGLTYPVEFTLDTAIFRIKNFNPAYSTFSYRNSRYGMWFDGISGSGNKMYVEGGISDAEGDFVGMEFSILSTEYWRGNVTSGVNELHKNKIVNADGSEVTNENKKNLNTNAHTAWIRNEISVNPDTFINFSIVSGGRNYISTNSINEYAESYINGNKEYKTISSSGDNEGIYINSNMLISPIIVPYVDSNYDPSTGNSNGIYIPLTSTVFEGDPEEPVDPDDPDEPETLEPADDPDTDYTPALPGDVTPGFEEWPYPNDDVIDGNPGDVYSWAPLYTSFIFKSYYKSNTGTFQPDSAWEFINDCTNASISEPFHALFKLATGHPSMQELIARIYELPFDYDLIFTDEAMLTESTINYGYVGILTVGFNNNGEADTTAVHYYNRTTKKFYQLNLGSLTLQKVFNNYLDYTDTVYKLNLPYGAGVVELDPNMLFDYGRVTAVISIKGYLDIDTGFLVIKVLLNNQLYYETSVNVAVDMIAYSTDVMAVPVALTKIIGSMALGTAGTSMMLEARYNYSKMLAETKNKLSKEKQEKITEETDKRLKLAEDSWTRMHRLRKGDDK